MLSLRGPELDEKSARGGSRLPPIRQEAETERLFQSRRDTARYPDDDDLRSESRLSLSSAERLDHRVIYRGKAMSSSLKL